MQDLHNHLFDCIERLMDAEGKELQQEVVRSRSVKEVASVIVEAAKIEALLHIKSGVGQIQGTPTSILSPKQLKG